MFPSFFLKTFFWVKERLKKVKEQHGGEDSPFNKGAGKTAQLRVKERTWSIVSQHVEKQWGYKNTYRNKFNGGLKPKCKA